MKTKFPGEDKRAQREDLLRSYLEVIDDDPGYNGDDCDAHEGVLKDFFVPHVGNNYHPHFLHTKRAVFYSSFFVFIKILVAGSVLMLPLQAFLTPDILAQQERELNSLISEFRENNDLVQLQNNQHLIQSSQLRSEDMLANNYFSHEGPNNHDFAYFLKQADYSYKTAGENLAMGFSNAKSVMQAWINSPLHYQNLIDSGFKETGISIAEGMYNNRSTIFITHHFGEPWVKTTGPANSLYEEITKQKIVENPTEQILVLGEKVNIEVIAEKPSIIYNKEDSNVFWQYNGQETTLTAKAVIKGAVSRANVHINGHEMILTKEICSTYSGKLIVAEPIDNFFKVVITPTITIISGTGERVVDAIPWYSIKVVSPSPTEKYLTAKTSLPGSVAWLFSFADIIYIIALIIFIISLLFNIFIQLHKQHPHVIAQTFMVIILLAVLLVV